MILGIMHDHVYVRLLNKYACAWSQHQVKYTMRYVYACNMTGHSLTCAQAMTKTTLCPHVEEPTPADDVALGFVAALGFLAASGLTSALGFLAALSFLAALGSSNCAPLEPVVHEETIIGSFMNTYMRNERAQSKCLTIACVGLHGLCFGRCAPCLNWFLQLLLQAVMKAKTMKLFIGCKKVHICSTHVCKRLRAVEMRAKATPAIKWITW